MKNILIFESDKNAQVALAMFFSGTDYSLSFFANEIELILKAQNKNNDLIIADSNMVKLTAIDFIDAINSNPITNSIPIIIISHNSKKTEVIKLLQAGATDFLIKTEMTQSKLLSRVDKALSPKKQGRKLIHLSSKPNSTGPQKETSKPTYITAKSTSNTIKPASQIIKPVQTFTPKQIQHQESFINNSLPLKQCVINPSNNKLELIISPDLCRKKIAKITNAKAIPFIASELMDMTSYLDTDIEKIASLIELDPAITVKVLKFANSAYYRRSKVKVITLLNAIRLIGFNGVRELILGVSVLDSFMPTSNTSELSNIKLFYHSLTTSVFAREIAKLVDYPSPETCFIVGLLHNIGISILNDNFNEEYKKVLKIVEEEKLDLMEVEEKLLGINHIEVACIVLKTWGFTDELIIPIKYHQKSLRQIFELPTQYRMMISIMHLANKLSSFIGADLSTHEALEHVPQKIFSYFNLSKKDIINFLPQMNNTVNELCQLLLLHIDHQEITKLNIISPFAASKKQRILILDNMADYVGPLECLFSKLENELYYSNDLITSYRRYSPNMICAYINTEQHLNTFIKDLESMPKIINSTPYILIIAPKEICQLSNSLLLQYENIKLLSTPYNMNHLLNILKDIDNVNMIQKRNQKEKMYDVNVDRVRSIK